MKEKPSLVWKPEFLLGIDSLDRQHKRIFDCLFAIENSMEKRDPWHIVEWFIADLDSTITSHCVAEETLLEVFAYPDIEQHRAQHGRLRAGIKELERALRESMSPQALVPYFEHWFVKHVLSEDLGYVEYLKPLISASGSRSPC